MDSERVVSGKKNAVDDLKRKLDFAFEFIGKDKIFARIEEQKQKERDEWKGQEKDAAKNKTKPSSKVIQAPQVSLMHYYNGKQGISEAKAESLARALHIEVKDLKLPYDQYIRKLLKSDRLLPHIRALSNPVVLSEIQNSYAGYYLCQMNWIDDDDKEKIYKFAIKIANFIPNKDAIKVAMATKRYCNFLEDKGYKSASPWGYEGILLPNHDKESFLFLLEEVKRHRGDERVSSYITIYVNSSKGDHTFEGIYTAKPSKGGAPRSADIKMKKIEEVESETDILAMMGWFADVVKV